MFTTTATTTGTYSGLNILFIQHSIYTAVVSGNLHHFLELTPAIWSNCLRQFVTFQSRRNYYIPVSVLTTFVASVLTKARLPQLLSSTRRKLFGVWFSFFTLSVLNICDGTACYCNRCDSISQENGTQRREEPIRLVYSNRTAYYLNIFLVCFPQGYPNCLLISCKWSLYSRLCSRQNLCQAEQNSSINVTYFCNHRLPSNGPYSTTTIPPSQN